MLRTIDYPRPHQLNLSLNSMQAARMAANVEEYEGNPESTALGLVSGYTLPLLASTNTLRK